jgi:predicted nucleic acid-binding protein
MLVYCDSMIVIYYLEHAGPVQVAAANRLVAIRSAGDQLAVSDLTRLECRVAPMRLKDAALLAKYDGFFGLPDVLRAPLTTAVYDRATHIRARHGFRTLDAIHLAAAVEQRCDLFLTNDTRLRAFPEIAVEVLT